MKTKSSKIIIINQLFSHKTFTKTIWKTLSICIILDIQTQSYLIHDKRNTLVLYKIMIQMTNYLS